MTHKFTLTRAHNSHRDSKSKKTQHHAVARRNTDHFHIIFIAFQQVLPSLLARLLYFLLSFTFFPKKFRLTLFFYFLLQDVITNNSHHVCPLTSGTLLILPYHLEHEFTIFKNHISVSDQLLRSLVSLNTDFNLHLGGTSVVTTKDSDFVSHVAITSKLSLP